MPTDYVKHLVECNCVLPQFKYRTPLIYHRFVIFSVVDDQGNIVPSFAQCPNCGIIHKVIEVGKSILMRREELNSILSEDEIAKSLPAPLTDILKQYKVDYATWQQAKFIIENEMWGRTISLSKEEIENITTGKILIILGHTLYKIDSYQKDIDEV